MDMENATMKKLKKTPIQIYLEPEQDKIIALLSKASGKSKAQVRRDKETLRAEARTDGVFTIVTNLEASRASKKQVLLMYKYQPCIEKRHALFKTELEVQYIFRSLFQ